MSELEAIHQSPDFAAALRLLDSADLPTSDLTEAHLRHFFYLGLSTAPAGLVGVEFHGPDALLRSLVVAPEYRSRGTGARLVARAEAYARDHGAVAVYILTTTAERFFRARGYITASREQAPVAIRETPEFSSLCPASSAFLLKRL
ncbi:arsenic resistance N-acetyltransferase ArsN2 [Steroidobacter agaridevorans]|nr:arsenic resistance N-acetyltransferase ArsN2 [Steroidobacter agaridevorans]